MGTAERVGTFVHECACGCGQTTSLASKTNCARSRIKGQPLKYIHGHSGGRAPADLGGRLWRDVKIGEADECWPWTGATNNGGYGRIWTGGRTRSTHKLAYELTNGPVPDGLVVRHRCDNPPCCNPAHLLTGTVKDNSSDAVERDRHAYGTRNGTAKLSESDVVEIRRRAAAGETQVSLAKAFRVSRAAIQWVIKRRTWAHVGGGVDA